jgi:sortase (surface protein transpeptidase)
MLDVPAVGLSARVVPVGLSGQGQLEVPAPTVAGWYRLGPAPGAVGAAVIVGHVDTYTGPAIFYRLTAVRPGDDVVVVRADGSESRFVISGVTVVRKAAFPSKAVFGPTEGAAIRLITCTGPFNPNSRHYLDSLIAWGVPANQAARR